MIKEKVKKIKRNRFLNNLDFFEKLDGNYSKEYQTGIPKMCDALNCKQEDLLYVRNDYKNYSNPDYKLFKSIMDDILTDDPEYTFATFLKTDSDDYDKNKEYMDYEDFEDYDEDGIVYSVYLKYNLIYEDMGYDSIDKAFIFTKETLELLLP